MIQINFMTFRLLKVTVRRNMSTFLSQFNRITGKMEWEIKEEDYDYQQEIARSSYADMLHDTERNQLYYKALAKAIVKKRELNQPVIVLDIGTGTGLLSMMAAKLGADTVYACEAFKPMAECARKIIKENGFDDKIHLIPKRSTEVTVGEGKDMPCRASILVTEVFDTELIGEGAIGTFTHAHKHLLEKDCSVVPSFSNLYIQLVNSDLVRKWNQLDDIISNKSVIVTSPSNISNCGGAPSLHDLQLDQLPMDTFSRLTEPVKVFRFDFTGQSKLPFDNSSIDTCTMLESGRIDGVFMWWDLEMDEEGEIILSCAPRWAHPTPNNMQWRDHWMQAIYYPYTQMSVAKGDKVKVISQHDEYSLWFDVAKETGIDKSLTERPICTCGAHVTYSRSRMGMLSDPVRRKTYIDVLKKYLTRDSTILCISDGSLIPLISAKLSNIKHIYTVESNHMCKRVICDFIKHNHLEDKITVLDVPLDRLDNISLPDKVDFVIGEPYFQTSLLPWDNMCFWYSAQNLQHLLSEKSVILPMKMTIYGVAVEFEHLWKIRADVGICEGFDLKQFDELINITSDSVDELIEPQPLWEYPCRASGEPRPLLEVDFQSAVQSTPSTDKSVNLQVKSHEKCNGVALWAEFNFDGESVISMGPRQSVSVGEKILWDYYSRQGVHLFYNNKKTSVSVEDCSVNVKVNFVPLNGDLHFRFLPNWR